MPERTVVVGARTGLHARPASLFVQAATRLPVKVTVACDGRPAVDARSLLSVLALGARHGDSVVLSAEGAGAEAAVEELALLVASDLDGPLTTAVSTTSTVPAGPEAKEQR